MTYQTQPGTIPHRAIEWLKTQPVGAEFTTAQICEAIDVDDLDGFSHCMKRARKAGLVRGRRARVAGKVYLWKLGDGLPEVDEQDEQDTDVDPAGQRIPFNAAFWQGGLILVGLRIRPDGTAFIRQEEARKLRKIVAWEYP